MAVSISGGVVLASMFDEATHLSVEAVLGIEGDHEVALVRDCRRRHFVVLDWPSPGTDLHFR